MDDERVTYFRSILLKFYLGWGGGGGRGVFRGFLCNIANKISFNYSPMIITSFF